LLAERSAPAGVRSSAATAVPIATHAAAAIADVVQKRCFFIMVLLPAPPSLAHPGRNAFVSIVAVNRR